MRRAPPQVTVARPQQDAVEEMAQMRASIVASRGELARMGELRDVNEHLVCSAMDSARAADDCQQALLAASRAAQRDSLTGLPNRALLLDRLVHEMGHARRVGASLGLLFVDLDDFSQVNEEFGHAVGDAVLQLVAARLTTTVRAEDTVSRYGADEFVILINDVADAAGALAIADKVLASLSTPCVLDGHALVLSASIGVSQFPQDGETAGVLIARADNAMFQAKRRGLGRCIANAKDDDPIERLPRVATISSKQGAAEVAPGTLQEMLRAANEQLVLTALGAHASQAAAEAAHRLQREHFAVVAHELRGPLTPIRMAAGMIERVPPDELPRMTSIIDREVVYMTRLIGDLLDLSRVHTGKLRLERQEIRLDSVIQDAVDICRETMATREQAFVANLEAGELSMYGDPARLTQVLRNLLENASKYTPHGGTITLETTRVGRTVAISISDTGIGITPDALPRVFEPFAQDAHAVGFNAAGLGIGLAVVRELVEAHGGTVLATSDGPGRGSCFVITLTLSGGAADTPESADPGAH